MTNVPLSSTIGTFSDVRPLTRPAEHDGVALVKDPADGRERLADSGHLGT